MPAPKLPSNYYTVRRISDEPRVYEICKWEFGRSRPLDVYSIVGVRDHCSCPSYKTPCKHVLMMQEALSRGYLDLDQMGKWIWVDGEWQEIRGI